MSIHPRIGPVRVAALALTTAAVATATAATASATTVAGGGSPVAPGSVLRAPLVAPATIGTTCNAGNLDATVAANPAGTVATTVTALNLSSCTGPQITGASLVAPAAGSVSFGSLASSVLSLPSLALKLHLTVGGISGYCTLAPRPSAAQIVNASSRVQFVSSPLGTGTGLCATPLPTSFTATFGPFEVLSVPPSPPPGSATVGSLVTVLP